MGAKSVVAIFFYCRDRKGFNFFSIKDGKEILTGLKRQLETLLKIHSSCCLHIVIFCKSNLKKCSFFQKSTSLSLKETYESLVQNIKNVPRYLINLKKYKHLLSRCDSEKNPSENRVSVLFSTKKRRKMHKISIFSRGFL
jgi:hypothetical protein